MLDALHTFLPQSSYHSSMGELNIFSAPFVLATMHRFENVNDKRRLSELVEELNNVHHSLMPVWMPMHPSTVKKLKEHGLILKVHQGPPVSYLQMLWALEQCALVLTDSGGLQKEAFFMKRPCITLRNETEWVELIEIGANELFTSNDSNLAKSIERMTSKEINYTFDGYGSGNAAFQIAQTLLHHSK
jgi:UDP-GlcNAc3NAcA epimerase